MGAAFFAAGCCTPPYAGIFKSTANDGILRAIIDITTTDRPQRRKVRKKAGLMLSGCLFTACGVGVSVHPGQGPANVRSDLSDASDTVTINSAGSDALPPDAADGGQTSDRSPDVGADADHDAPPDRPDIDLAGDGASDASDGTNPVASQDAAGDLSITERPADGSHPDDIDPDMASIPGGSFVMGSEYAAPLHQVTVGSFQMDRNEVTTSQYSACVAAGGCTVPLRTDGNCNYGIAERGQHPINCVNPFEAARFCSWAEKRLPTEEEWEYAARNLGQWLYPWGGTLPDASLANFCGDECTGIPSTYGNDGFPASAPVGSFPLGDTPQGLHDMAGNVFEYTASRFCPYPSTPCNSCVPNAVCVTPCSTCNEPARVLRGGGWMDAQTDFIFRFRGNSDGAVDYVGFRCAR